MTSMGLFMSLKLNWNYLLDWGLTIIPSFLLRKQISPVSSLILHAITTILISPQLPFPKDILVAIAVSRIFSVKKYNKTWTSNKHLLLHDLAHVDQSACWDDSSNYLFCQMLGGLNRNSSKKHLIKSYSILVWVICKIRNNILATGFRLLEKFQCWH